VVLVLKHIRASTELKHHPRCVDQKPNPNKV
jgi:hypothetical protein